MRKFSLLSLILITVMLSSVTLAVVPGYEEAGTQHKIADYTLEFLHSNGMGGTGSFDILSDKRYTDDEVIELTLKGCWTMNETYIRRITHVNGIPIEQTKWAKYGGTIQHKGGNYDVNPAEIPAQEPKEITVFVNNEQVAFPDQKPVIIRGRTMVPVRAVFEHKFVQALVDWDEENGTVTAKDRTGRIIVFRIGDYNYRLRFKGEEEYKYSDVAPVIENSRTLLPLRALSESLNFQVDWIEKDKKVEIKEKAGYNRELMSPESWATYLRKGGK